MSTKLLITNFEIVKGKKKKKHIEYKLEVTENNNTRLVYRRYTQFKKLYGDLKKTFPKKKFSFPRKILFGNLKEKHIKERTKLLQSFLNIVISDRKFTNTISFKRFIGQDVKSFSRAIKQQSISSIQLDLNKNISKEILKLDGQIEIDFNLLSTVCEEKRSQSQMETLLDKKTCIHLLKQLGIQSKSSSKIFYKTVNSNQKSKMGIQKIFTSLIVFSSGKENQKIKLMFQIIDKNDEGTISIEDLSKMVSHLINFLYQYSRKEIGENEANSLMGNCFSENQEKTLNLDQFIKCSNQIGINNMLELRNFQESVDNSSDLEEKNENTKKSNNKEKKIKNQTQLTESSDSEILI
ncbi:sorting nexin-29-related [Anaeramoeba flamelloides]|uniref:Sorting nexin-29-related n=1 Tax=Anaeramoeba flamelloides TaxID=1746091 RepID=A0AAV7ZJF0_9EUKA|nr:sorting nexin-29-related [Anaeramoeba flamelloides]